MKYQWNTDNLAAMAKGLEQTKESVDKQKAILTDCINASETSFQGNAGEEFRKNLREDLERMGKLSSLLETQIQKVRLVASKYYGACEENIKAKVQELRANP